MLDSSINDAFLEINTPGAAGPAASVDVIWWM